MTSWSQATTIGIWYAQAFLWGTTFGPDDVRAALQRAGADAGGQAIRRFSPDGIPPMPGIYADAYRMMDTLIRTAGQTTIGCKDQRIAPSTGIDVLRGCLSGLASIREFLLEGPELGARAIGDALLVLIQRISAAIEVLATSAQSAFERFWGFSPSELLEGAALFAVAGLLLFGAVALSPAGQSAILASGRSQLLIAGATARGAGMFASSTSRHVIPALTKWIPRPG